MDATTAGGYVKLWRSWIDHPIWADMPPACGRIALTCLCLANWRPAEWYDGRAEVVIPRGSFVTSLEKLSALARTSKKQTRYSLHKLEFVAHFLTTEKTHHWTMVSISNYERYQSADEAEGTANVIANGTAGAQQGHSKGTVVALIEEGKKGRREEKRTPPTPSFALGDFPEWFARVMVLWPNKSDAQLAQQFLSTQPWLTDGDRVHQFEHDVKVWGSCEKHRWKNGMTCPKLYQFVKDYELGYRGQEPAEEVDALTAKMRGI